MAPSHPSQGQNDSAVLEQQLQTFQLAEQFERDAGKLL